LDREDDWSDMEDANPNDIEQESDLSDTEHMNGRSSGEVSEDLDDVDTMRGLINLEYYCPKNGNT